MLEQTIERAQLISKNIILSTTQELAPLFENIIQSYGLTLLTEPAARNTAPAILLAALTVFHQDPQAIIVMVPADHLISPIELFLNDVHTALEIAQKENHMVLFGIKPEQPTTHYGYLEYDPSTGIVLKFHEKPNYATAQLYTENPNMLWNSGIFCAQAQVFINAYKEHAPDIYHQLLQPPKEQMYHQLTAQSFDHRILEKMMTCKVIPAQFQWSDVGTLESFCAAQKTSETRTIAYNAENNIVVGTKKLVSLLGVQNLCVIETDDILFIADREYTNQVTCVVNNLTQHGLAEYQ